MKSRPRRQEPQGAVLVTTLIVLTVLAVVAVAFMQSTSMDQLSSRSTSGSYRAQLAADAGVAVARGQLAQLITRYPDSVTVWQNIGGGPASGTNNEATVLYARSNVATPNTPARPAQFGAEVAFIGFPLVSSTNTDGVPVANLTNHLPFAPTDPLMVNLNATNASQPEAFIGTRSMTNPGAPIAAAQWIYIGRSPGPTNATNPAVARYAYWVEDESFKVNVNTATNGARGVSTNVGPGDLRLDGSWQSASNAAVRNANAAAVVADRGTNTNFFPTAGSAAVAAALTSAASAAELRFLTTANSAGLDLTRGGFKRFNINTITNGDKRTALNRLILAITNTNAAPLFGQRFYRTANNPAGINNISTVTTDHANIYLQKIAANIYDYIDSDDQPTIINNDAAYSLRTGRPTEAIYAQGGGTDGDNSIAAMGVENLPRLQEYAIHARIRKMQWTNDPDSFGFASTGSNAPSPLPETADYEIWIDHYFEFWNPGTRGFTNTNASAFLQIDKLPAFLGSDPNDPISKERSITNISIPVGTVFPAGEVTVLTTAPLTEVSLGSAANFALLTNAANVVFLSVPDADRKFTGKTSPGSVKTFTYNSQSPFGPSFPYDKLFQVSLSPGPQTKASVLLGNSTGILESFVGLPVNAQQNVSAIGLDLTVTNGYIREGMAHVSLAAGNNDNIRGGSLRGNTNSSGASPVPFGSQGDPRALNEQLTFLNFSTTTSDSDQTRFYVTVTGTAAFPEDSTMGRPNANFVNSTNWVDVSSLNPSNTNAPLVVRNGAMQTIGELGHITDPARVAGGSGTMSRARGGGRSLRIGQGEYSNTSTFTWFYGNQTLASRTWTSWRLADILTATTNTNIAMPGLVNPNGALRDNGAALRGAFFGLTFLPAGPDGASSIAGRPANITNVVTNVISRLTNGAAGGLTNALNPFWERGEISELTVLNSAASGSVASGAVMSNAFDRGREELVRRSIEMITTRGSVFTVYAIGQALQIPTNASGAPLATNVLGTTRVKSTFEMTPQFISPAATNDAFNPASVAGVNQRFSPPTNYTTRIISSTYD
jgi:hypothetical protein